MSLEPQSTYYLNEVSEVNQTKHAIKSEVPVVIDMQETNLCYASFECELA